MAEAIIDGFGNNNYLRINSDGSINISGIDITIGSLALSLENIYVTSGDNLNLGSAWSGVGSTYITNTLTVNVGSELYIPAGSVIVTNTVAGSIISMPTVNVSVGSEQWIKNWNEIGSSVVVTNLYTGSKVWQGDIFGVSGIVEISNRVAGSIVNMPIVGISGTLIGVSGIVNQGTNPWVVSGNVLVSGTISIASPSTIGSYTGMSNGSIWWGGGVGSFVISGTSQILGSVAITTSVIPVSGTLFTQLVGSFYNLEVAPNAGVKSNPEYDLLYIVSGTATGVTGSTLGSIVMYIGVGSYIQVLTYANDYLVNVGSWS